MKNRLELDLEWKLYLNHNDAVPEEFKFPEDGIPARVPGTVHTDLLNANLIPDPFYSDNELRLQWIAEADWRYETFFNLPQGFDIEEDHQFVFKGLDTVADVRLNDQILGSTINMFHEYKFNVNHILKDKDNHLIVEFHSPLDYVRKNKKPISQFPSARHSDRVFLRKAQYSFGWDWGPSYATSGIWRPVFLEKSLKTSINSLYFETLNIGDGKAEISVRAVIKGNPVNGSHINLKISNGHESFQKKMKLNGQNTLEIRMDIPDPQLWWPAGQGSPHMYDLRLTLLDARGNEIDSISRKVGIRTVKLVLQDNGGQAFRFIINDKPLFLKGANWIPADSFLPRIDKAKYEQLIKMAVGANMNVLRVWGGGIYEDDYFYQLCDENGLLVWQDFMFACAAYPEHEEFINTVKDELEYNISRLQTHPSILIWCGNNENEWIWYRDHSGPVEEMPGFKLFHKYFPEWLKSWDPSRPYWPSSPFGNEKDPNDPASGNYHQWQVWSGWKDYSKVVEDTSLFVTEFGFQGPANLHTLQNVIPEEHLHPQSRIFEFHNKQDEGPERLMRFLNGHLPVRMDLPSYIYLTQLNQAFALKTCLEHWRNRWPKTAGSIIWQINDCWPVTSWALIDSHLKPKLAYYAVAKAFAPVQVSFKQEQYSYSIVLHVPEMSNRKIEWQLLEINRLGQVRQIAGEIIIPSQSGCQGTGLYDLQKQKMNPEMVYMARIYNCENGEILAENIQPGQRWKHMRLPQGNIEKRIVDGTLKIESDFPAFFLSLNHSDINVSDNGFCLLPGEVKDIRISRLTENINEFTVNYLNLYL